MCHCSSIPFYFDEHLLHKRRRLFARRLLKPSVNTTAPAVSSSFTTCFIEFHLEIFEFSPWLGSVLMEAMREDENHRRLIAISSSWYLIFALLLLDKHWNSYYDDIKFQLFACASQKSDARVCGEFSPAKHRFLFTLFAVEHTKVEHLWSR